MIEKVLSESLSRVSTFYEREGIDTGASFRIGINQDYFALNPHASANVPGGMEAQGKMMQEMMEAGHINFMIDLFKTYDLSISFETAKQTNDLRAKRAEEVFGYKPEKIKEIDNSEADIIIYKPTIDGIERHGIETFAPYLDSLLAHEIWHVIEKREGVLNNFIFEGTATHAQKQFDSYSGKITYTPRKIEVAGDHAKRAMAAAYNMILKILYEEGSKIVARNTKSLSEMLVPAIRERMDKELLELYNEEHRKYLVPDKERLQHIASVERALIPELDSLDEELSQENLVASYRAFGANLLADEIEKQDCSKFLGYQRSLGYGPK